VETKAFDLYTAGLEGLTEKYGSLSMAFIVAVIDTAQHEKIIEVPYIVSAFLELTHFNIPLPLTERKPSTDLYTEGLKSLMRLFSGNASLAFLWALKDITNTNPEAIQLRDTISAYESMVSKSMYGEGLLGLNDKLGSPTSAVKLALQDCLITESLEHIDQTVQAANLLFGTSWFRPEQNAPVSVNQK